MAGEEFLPTPHRLLDRRDAALGDDDQTVIRSKSKNLNVPTGQLLGSPQPQANSRRALLQVRYFGPSKWAGGAEETGGRFIMERDDRGHWLPGRMPTPAAGPASQR